MRIRYQLALAVFVTGGLGEAAVFAYRAASTTDILEARAETRAQAIAEVAEDLVAPALRSGDARSLSGKLEILARLPGVIDISVSDQEGRLVARAQSPAARPGFSRQTMIGGSADVIDAVFQQAIGNVQVRMSKRHLQERFQSLGWREAALGTLSLIALAAISWLIGSLLGRRLESMAEAVQDMKPGRRLSLPDGGGDSEADRLARAINSLDERLLSEMGRRETLELFKDDLMNMLVHDMKHPITVLTVLLKLMGDDDQAAVSKEKRAALLRMAQKNLRRENGMIDDLLQVARLSNPEIPLHKRRLSLAAFVAECASENSLIAEQSQREWGLEIDEELPACWIYGDAVLLKRLIGNLVLNAIEHSPPDSRITLGARLSKRDHSKAEIFVKDQGEGVPPQRREAIFQKYTTFAESARNVGLGLAFCKMAAASHSARLELLDASEPGTTFALLIPISTDPAAVNGPETRDSEEDPLPAQG